MRQNGVGQRQRQAERRSRTIDEIVETALAVMSESGAAGLSLGEVAKRMGMRTPSLYGYFASRAALCDEIFARGWAGVRAAVRPHLGVRAGESLAGHVERVGRVFVGWALAHAAEAQLMFWRPVLAWSPSPAAYEPAVAAVADLGESLGAARAAGLVRADADLTEMAEVLTVLTAGVVSQQLSNEPGVAPGQGTYARHLGRLASMFAAEYGATGYGATGYRAAGPEGEAR